jgi:hypothetical protein
VSEVGGLKKFIGWLYRHTKKIKKMMERLVAAIEKMDVKHMIANQEQLKEEMRVSQKFLKDIMLAKTDTNQEVMDAKLHGHHESMMARKSQLEEIKNAVDVCEKRLNKMDTMDLETSREKSNAVVEQRDVPKEEAAVKTTGPLEEGHGDRQLAAERRRQQRKRTRAMVCPGRSWPLPEKSWCGVPFLHRARHTVVRDQSGTTWYGETLKDERSGRDVGRSRNATTA